MSIKISYKIKKRILEYLDANSMYSSFNSSFVEKAIKDLEI